MFLSVCVHGVAVLCVHANHQIYDSALLKMCVIIKNGYYGSLTMTNVYKTQSMICSFVGRRKKPLKTDMTSIMAHGGEKGKLLGSVKAGV